MSYNCISWCWRTRSGCLRTDIREQKHLKYVRDANEAIDDVRNGANVAFIMNPVRMEQMRDVAFAGEVLPQKSTDFYPKMLSGLTIYSLGRPRKDRRREDTRLPKSGRVSRLVPWRPSAASALLFASLLARHAIVHAQSAEQNQLAVYSPQTSYSVPLLEVNGQLYAGLGGVIGATRLGGCARRRQEVQVALYASWWPPSGVAIYRRQGQRQSSRKRLQTAGKFCSSEWAGLCSACRQSAI